MRLHTLISAPGAVLALCSQVNAATVVGNPKIVATIECYDNLVHHAPVQSLRWTFTDSNGVTVANRHLAICDFGDGSCTVHEPIHPWYGLTITIDTPMLVDCGTESVSVRPQSIRIDSNGAGAFYTVSGVPLWLYIDHKD